MNIYIRLFRHLHLLGSSCLLILCLLIIRLYYNALLATSPVLLFLWICIVFICIAAILLSMLIEYTDTTSVSRATIYDHTERENSANPNATDQLGNTLLHKAIIANKLDTALTLIKNGANPNATNNSDEIPLHTAISLNKLDIALALIKKGANPNATNLFGETPLHIAIRHRYTDIVMLLIEVGAKINLHLAVEYCHTDVVIGLMQTGIDVHATDQLGNTALDIAIRLNKLATALAIIHYGKVYVANLAPIKGNPTSEYIQRLYSQANNFRTPSGVRGFFAGMNASHLDDMMAKIKIHVMATGIKDGYLTIMNLLRDKSPSGKLAPSLLPHELLGIILQYAGLLPPNIDINLSKLPNFVKTPSTDLEKNSTLSSTSAKPDSTICHESLYPQRDELIQAGRMLMLPSP